MCAARLGSLPLLQHLVSKYGISLSTLGTCLICIQCDTIKFDEDHDDHNTEHCLIKDVSVAHGAAIGGAIDIMQYILVMGGSVTLDAVRTCPE